MRDALLAADERKHFGLWIERHIELAFHVIGTGLTISERTGVIGILVVRGIADGLSHSIHDMSGRGHIGVADSERDHIDTLFGEGCFLGIDLGEQVGGKVVQAFGGLHGSPFVEVGWWQRVCPIERGDVCE